MTEIKPIPPGTFCWTELMSPDVPASKRFYSELFNWRYSDTALDERTLYTVFHLRENQKVAGLFTIDERLRSLGLRPDWLNHIAVGNIYESCDIAQMHGGKLLSPPNPAVRGGLVCIIEDPVGAFVALWQQDEEYPGLETTKPVLSPISLCWAELIVKESDVVRDFYCQLLGWTTQVQDMDSTTYTSFLANNHPVGGLLPMKEEWGHPQSYWLPYFTTDDCDACCSRIRLMGGTIKVAPTELTGVGRFAVATDPQGATFALIRLSSVSNS